MNLIESGDALQRLRNACAKICWQNHHLLLRIAAADFNPALELDCTLNKAQYYLTDFYDAFKFFPHGEVPTDYVKGTVRSSTKLITAIVARYGSDAEVRRLANIAGHVFRSSQRVWGSTLPYCRLSSEEYCRELDSLRDKFLAALSNLNLRLNELDLPVIAAKVDSRHAPRARATDDALTQDDVAADFGVTRQTVAKWERGGKKNPWGYYKELRLNPDLRGAYNLLAGAAKAYNRAKEEAKRRGVRFRTTFVAFNERYLQHSSEPRYGQI